MKVIGYTLYTSLGHFGLTGLRGVSLLRIHAQNSLNASGLGESLPHVIQQLFAWIFLYIIHEEKKNIRTNTKGTKRTAMLISFPKKRQKR